MSTYLIVLGEFFVFGFLMFLLSLGIAWKSGYLRTLFFTIETGNIGYVDVGETNKFTYPNVPGKVLRNGVLMDGDSEAEKTWTQKEFGLYWIGFSFLGRKVHQFSIVPERESRELKPGMLPANWIERENARIVSELRWKFPRPVLVPDLKFQDKIEANILVLCKFEVLRPNVPIYIQKGNFFDTLVSFVRSGVVEYCQMMSFVQFVEKNKLDGEEMSRDIIRAINHHIEDEVGVRLTGLAVPIYNASRLAEEEALEAAELARLNGLATIATSEAAAKAVVVRANAEAERKIIDAKALAKADRILGQASVADVLATARNFKKLGADPDNAVHSATALGRAKRFAEKDSPVTTLVDGQSSVALPLPEKKVVLATR